VSSFLVICCVIHIIINITFLILKMLKVFKFDYIMLLISILIPIWGSIMLLSMELSEKLKKRNVNYIEMARMRANQTMRSIEVDENKNDIVPINEAMIVNDSNYQMELLKDILYDVSSSIVIDSDNVVEKVVPLQEAMVMNDSATKRELIMDVLYTNPSDYISQLTEAKSVEDTEVVHYAVTALVELQKEFDVKFQNILKKKEENPTDEVIDREYLKLQEQYISCGLLEGDGLRTQQLNYRNHLLEIIERGNRNWSIQSKLAEIDLRLKDQGSLAKDVDYMMENWPDREGTFYYRIQLEILRKRADKIYEIIDEIEKSDMYISSEMKEIIQFWSDGNERKKGQGKTK